MVIAQRRARPGPIYFYLLALLSIAGLLAPTTVDAATRQTLLFARDCGGTVSAPGGGLGRTWTAGLVQPGAGETAAATTLIEESRSSGAATIVTGDQLSPSLATDLDGQPFVAWQDFRNGNADIYAASSPDGGLSWDAAVRVNKDTGSAVQDHPSLAADIDGLVYVAWQDFRRGQSDIYFARSSDGGAAWSAAVRVNKDTGTAAQDHPSLVAGAHGALYLAWQDHRNGNADIYFARSVDAGVHWSANRKVNNTSTLTSQVKPSIALETTCEVDVAWEDDRNGNLDIYISRSINNGVNWSANVKVNDTGDTSNQTDPDLAVDVLNNLYVAWDDTRNGSADIYSASSTDEGVTWSSNVKVNTTTDASNQTDPDLGVRSIGKLYVVWEDDRDATNDIYGARSLNSGTSWTQSARISYGVTTTTETAPSVAVPMAGLLLTAWQGFNDGETAVFSSRSSTGLSWGSRARVSSSSSVFSAPQLPAYSMALVRFVFKLSSPLPSS